MQPAPVSPIVAIEDLEKLDIRVGTIAAEGEIPSSKMQETHGGLRRSPALDSGGDTTRA